MAHAKVGWHVYSQVGVELYTECATSTLNDAGMRYVHRRLVEQYTLGLVNRRQSYMYMYMCIPTHICTYMQFVH